MIKEIYICDKCGEEIKDSVCYNIKNSNTIEHYHNGCSTPKIKYEKWIYKFKFADSINESWISKEEYKNMEHNDCIFIEKTNERWL